MLKKERDKGIECVQGIVLNDVLQNLNCIKKEVRVGHWDNKNMLGSIDFWSQWVKELVSERNSDTDLVDSELQVFSL